MRGWLRIAVAAFGSGFGRVVLFDGGFVDGRSRRGWLLSSDNRFLSGSGYMCRMVDRTLGGSKTLGGRYFGYIVDRSRQGFLLGDKFLGVGGFCRTVDRRRRQDLLLGGHRLLGGRDFRRIVDRRSGQSLLLDGNRLLGGHRSLGGKDFRRIVDRRSGKGILLDGNRLLGGGRILDAWLWGGFQ